MIVDMIKESSKIDITSFHAISTDITLAPKSGETLDGRFTREQHVKLIIVFVHY